MLETILRYILLYFIIISGSIFVHYKTNKKLGSSIPIYILTIIVILYIFGLFKGLLIGAYFITITSIWLGMYAIIRMSKDKRREILDVGTIFFTIIYCVFMITTYEKVSNIWDEYSYWSLTTKQMYYTNIYQLNGYPPMPNIWEYFVCRVVGGYSQGIEIFSLYIFVFSLLLPLFNINNKTNNFYKFGIGIICLCLPAVFSKMYFYIANYADAIIGAILGYIFLEAYFNKKSKTQIYILIISLITLSLTKATGFYIALILLFTYAVIKIITELKETKKLKINNYKAIILLILVVLISYLSWNIYAKINITDKSNMQITTNDVPDVGTISDFFKSLISVSIKSIPDVKVFDMIQENLVTCLIKQNIISAYISLSIGGFILAYFAIILLIYRKKQDKNIKKVIYFIAISLFLYIVFLQITYFLKFNLTESLTHNSFDRYISSYFLGMLIYLVALLINVDKEKSSVNIALLMILILAITPIKDLTNATINAGYYNNKISNEINSIIEETNELKKQVPENAKIYVINQQLEDNKFRYFMLPENEVTIGIYFGKSSVKNEREQLIKILYESYEYIYIRATDEYFNDYYSDIFESEIKEKEVYKIIKDENINNIKVERVDINE